MSKLAEQLRSLHIVNAWDFAGHGNVYIEFCAAIRGRWAMPAKWIVRRPGHDTYAGGPWYDFGNKALRCSRITRREALEEIKQWAGEKYGIKEWARTPYGSWMDAEFVKRRLAKLKAQLKAAK